VGGFGGRTPTKTPHTFPLLRKSYLYRIELIEWSYHDEAIVSD
jgi:hypothetical protein